MEQRVSFRATHPITSRGVFPIPFPVWICTDEPSPQHSLSTSVARRST